MRGFKAKADLEAAHTDGHGAPAAFARGEAACHQRPERGFRRPWDSASTTRMSRALPSALTTRSSASRASSSPT